MTPSADLDADERMDLLVSSSIVNERAGALWILTADDREGYIHDLDSPAPTFEEAAGHLLQGTAPNFGLGDNLATGQDYNLDGVDDFLISSLEGAEDVYGGGAVYLFYGTGI
jgi:hypothetical protein